MVTNYKTNERNFLENTQTVCVISPYAYLPKHNDNKCKDQRKQNGTQGLSLFSARDSIRFLLLTEKTEIEKYSIKKRLNSLRFSLCVLMTMSRTDKKIFNFNRMIYFPRTSPTIFFFYTYLNENIPQQIHHLGPIREESSIKQCVKKRIQT